MKKQIKKYIRGNTKRGHEVIAELEKLGGKNILKLKGNEYDKVYYIARYKYSEPNTIDFVSEKSFIGQLIVTHPDWEEIELPKTKYPKTYEECCKVLNITLQERCQFDFEPYGEELYNLHRLLICRDAYWKIAGEEMGLGKSWKPQKGITYCYISSGPSCIRYMFPYPTEEMRDAFRENFGPDIEICEELL